VKTPILYRKDGDCLSSKHLPQELPEGVDFTARFVREDESYTDGGTDLGLSVAESFTEACGSTFRVETVADIFTALVSFPVSEQSASQ